MRNVDGSTGWVAARSVGTSLSEDGGRPVLVVGVIPVSCPCRNNSIWHHSRLATSLSCTYLLENLQLVGPHVGTSTHVGQIPIIVVRRWTVSTCALRMRRLRQTGFSLQRVSSVTKKLNAVLPKITTYIRRSQPALRKIGYVSSPFIFLVTGSHSKVHIYSAPL